MVSVVGRLAGDWGGIRGPGDTTGNRRGMATNSVRDSRNRSGGLGYGLNTKGRRKEGGDIGERDDRGDRRCTYRVLGDGMWVLLRMWPATERR